MPRTHRSRERGVALILTFLTLMILVVVIVQIKVTSSVDSSVSANALRELQFEYAASGALEEAKGHLLRDLKEEAEQSQSGGDSAGGDPMGGLDPESGGDPFGDQDGGAADDTSSAPADSIGPDEDWANFDKLTYAGEVEVSIRIIDEDRKFNLLQLAATDEDARKSAKERLVRLLDTFREDSKQDLSISDATEIAEGIEAWLKGDRPEDYPKPKQPAKLDADGEEVKDDDTEQKVYFPLGIEELVRLPAMSEFILHGFLEDDGRRYVPGFEDVATVFSSQTFDDSALPKSDDEKTFKNPFDESSKNDKQDNGSGGKNSKQPGSDDGTGGKNDDAAGAGEDDDGDGDSGEGEGGEGEGGAATTATNEGRININTAPLVVLRSLLPNDEMPWSVLEKIDQFRRKALDDADASAQTLFDKNKKKDKSKGKDQDDKSDEDSALDEPEEDYVFHTADEVVDKVEKDNETTFDLSDEVKAKFTELLAVKSNVFTVLIALRHTKDSDQKSSLFTKNEAQVYNRVYRAVIWRRTDSDGKFRAITLSPLTKFNGILPPDSEDYKEKYPFGF